MITKSPTIKNKFINNKHFTKSARIAFSYILKVIDFKKNESILIPAYIGYTEREGSGVLDPIEENKVNYLFYPIEKDFKINTNTIKKMVEKKSIKALLLIHYYGILHCDILEIKRICKENNVLLIEDCAHTLYSKYKNKYLGDFGDFSFYSLHKVLPIKSGGYFKINNKKYFNTKLKVINEDKAPYNTLEALLQYDELNSKDIVLKNYEYMSDKLKNIDGLEVVFPHLEEGIYPLNLPIYLTKIPREEFYFKMIDSGITLISLYYQLINSIQESEYPTSHLISKKILNLPINQDIKKNEMDLIISFSKEILEKKNV